jgi:hypothetical protein
MRSKGCQTYFIVIEACHSSRQGVQIVLVPHLITRSVARPKFAGVVVGTGHQNVAQGMPLERPHDAVVRLFNRSDLFVSPAKQDFNLNAACEHQFPLGNNLIGTMGQT